MYIYMYNNNFFLTDKRFVADRMHYQDHAALLITGNLGLLFLKSQRTHYREPSLHYHYQASRTRDLETN